MEANEEASWGRGKGVDPMTMSFLRVGSWGCSVAAPVDDVVVVVAAVVAVVVVVVPSVRHRLVTISNARIATTGSRCARGPISCAAVLRDR